MNRRTSASAPSSSASPLIATKSENTEELALIEQALLRIRCSQSRRALAREAPGPVEPAQLGVIDAVEQGPGEDGQPATVGLVAQRLGIDPSRASRTVAAAIDAGYVARAASELDGRSSILELTLAGREVADNVHAARRARYAELLNDWTPADRAEFAKLLHRFTSALDEAPIRRSGKK